MTWYKTSKEINGKMKKKKKKKIKNDQAKDIEKRKQINGKGEK